MRRDRKSRKVVAGASCSVTSTFLQQQTAVTQELARSIAYNTSHLPRLYLPYFTVRSTTCQHCKSAAHCHPSGIFQLHNINIMATVSLLNVTVRNNPAAFSDPYEFEITFECLEPLMKDLEWKLTYVGSATS